MFLFVSFVSVPFPTLGPASDCGLTVCADMLLARCFLAEAPVAQGWLAMAERAGPICGTTVLQLLHPRAPDAEAVAPAWRTSRASFGISFEDRIPYPKPAPRLPNPGVAKMPFRVELGTERAPLETLNA